MTIKEVKLNPDGSLNILDINKVYFLVANFHDEGEKLRIYINESYSHKHSAFNRIYAIDSKRDKFEVIDVMGFYNDYLQYSIEDALKYRTSRYTKQIFECIDAHELIQYCIDNQKLFNLTIK